MKKIFLLLAAMSIVTTSCNKNDDDNSSNSPDPILGKWFYHKSFKNGKEETINDCEKKSSANFTEAKSYTFASYEIDGKGEDAECNEVDTNTGTWENMGNGNYKFSSPGDDDDTYKINFEGNTFNYTETDTYLTTDKDGNEVEVTDTYIIYLMKK